MTGAVAVATVALVGPRAAGKSTVGAALARELGWQFVDADERLAARAGMPAGDYLRQRGEAAFRRLEQDVSAPLLLLPATVVALGGGAVLSETLRARLLRPAVLTALLLADPTVLARRIAAAATARPPLSDLPPEREVRALLAERLSRYRSVAQVEFDTDAASADEIALALAARVRAAPGA